MSSLMAGKGVADVVVGAGEAMKHDLTNIVNIIIYYKEQKHLKNEQKVGMLLQK